MSACDPPPAATLTETIAMPQSSPAITGRILIADDHQQNRELLEAYLADDGHEILMTIDGQQTLDQSIAERPDLILLDIMMPKLSGYEVCQRLKQNEATRDIPVLMVTALKETGDIERAVAAGATPVAETGIVTMQSGTREIMLRDPDTRAFVLFYEQPR